jgi:Dolichyl-phosphate-mannose-protein mannosyltransferase
LWTRHGSKILVAVLLAHAALLAWSAKWHSPTFNEIGHVPAGLSHWQYQRFELYRVNPPLPRMVATLPLLFCDVKTNWSNYGLSPFSREEIPMGIRFARANGSRTFDIFTIARWACIPFCLLGAWICYRWALELWGNSSAWIALLLWCTSPFILGHGPLVMPDVPAAALGLAACYLFWRWLKQPNWLRAAAAGIVLGLAELSKTTLLVFFAIWPILWCAWAFTSSERRQKASCFRQAVMMAVMAFLTVSVINLGYGFAGTGQRLGDFQFQSRLLSGGSGEEKSAGNRFAGTWLAAAPVPLPRDYLQGIDRQRTDFEEGDRSYLRGKWEERGWWHYHLYGLAVKTPLGTLVLLAIAVFVSVFRRGYSRRWPEELALLLPTAAILALVSSQTGFGNHVRYTIPALPFLFVWMSKVGQAFALRDRAVAFVACVSMAGAVAGSLWIYPHSASYFNELVGGPKNGHNHLVDSNVAWGQDILFLRRWLDEHPDAKPIGLASYGWIHPHLAGIDFSLPPVGPKGPGVIRNGGDGRQLGPLPGWYAIDVNFLHGPHWSVANEEGGWTTISPDGLNYEYFLRFQPVDRVGYSIYIYRITPEEADEARRDMGLPPLVVCKTVIHR